MNRSTLPRIAKTSRVVTYSFLTYVFFGYLFARNTEKLKLKVAMSRRISRATGYMCSMPLPPYLRKYIYLGFGKLYGVNFDDIQVSDLNSFQTFNQFFTRELKPEARPIYQVQNDLTMCSPCDGKILSFGDVNTMNCTIDCIKGHDYRLDEFLFGFKQDKLKQEKD